MSWDNTDTNGGDQWGDGGANGFDNGTFDTGNDGFDDAGTGAGDGGRPRGACFNCGEEGHNKADCPKPRILRCHHCNQEGHTIRSCPDPDCPPQEPREFTGECRTCGKEGHRAADCPDRPPMICKNCGEEGHQASDCEKPRVIDRSHIADVNPDVAWNKIASASAERDMDDAKEGIQEYLKSAPEITYVELENAFRQQDIGVYIIAVEKPQLLGALTNMDLQGNLGKKYTITYRFDPKPARERERQFFPENTEDNLERLKDAGEPVNSGKLKCNNCDEYGHVARDCPSDKVEKEQVVVKCFNCGEEGHRVRDCPTPRIDKFACKNCNQPGHKVAECPEPRNPENVDCRKCGEKGHFSRDCPQGGGGGGACHNCGQEGHRAKDCTEPKKTVCRNCDEEGHVSRDCPKPRDYSRVKCSNCGEMGHTKVRCKQPVPNPDADEVGGDADAADTAPAGSGDAGGDLGAAGSGNDFGGGNSGADWNSGTADGW
ncbi:hypothetical protein SCAR479_00714 [Seiridium cardinale]|uniref:CCHC-type domain-containing protein n=1 Tax=Seiridium cardinale TaxID=138064 RepID=A0ABR2Y6L6_9PEZI